MDQFLSGRNNSYINISDIVIFPCQGMSRKAPVIKGTCHVRCPLKTSCTVPYNFQKNLLLDYCITRANGLVVITPAQISVVSLWYDCHIQNTWNISNHMALNYFETMSYSSSFISNCIIHLFTYMGNTLQHIIYTICGMYVHKAICVMQCNIFYLDHFLFRLKYSPKEVGRSTMRPY